jgi:hypothetical protein
MFNMITTMKKQVLIRGVDEATYRRAKSVAALQGVSMGSAVSEALKSWVEDGRKEDEIQKDLKQNVDYVRSHWSELKKHQGKAVVISGKKLQGIFSSYEEARGFSSKFRVALAFSVDQRPARREIELGPELEVQ